ncbi:MAG: GNAT family N-acetyltransferase [Sneathiella sp.]
MQLKFLVDYQGAIPVVARWYYEEWGHEVAGNSYEKTCERIRGKLNRDKVPLHIIAVENNNPLGVAQLKTQEMDIYPDKKYWLGSVYVASEARGRGIASKLAGKIVETANSFGIETLYLQTEKLVDGGLYSRVGWMPIEQVHYHGLDVLVMKRDL